MLISMKGLAYVDFLDDEHLVAAVAKNKNTLLGKKLSIARSDPKRGGKETFDPKNTEHGKSTFFFFFFYFRQTPTGIYVWI